LGSLARFLTCCQVSAVREPPALSCRSDALLSSAKLEKSSGPGNLKPNKPDQRHPGSRSLTQPRPTDVARKHKIGSFGINVCVVKSALCGTVNAPSYRPRTRPLAHARIDSCSCSRICTCSRASLKSPGQRAGDALEPSNAPGLSKSNEPQLRKSATNQPKGSDLERRTFISRRCAESLEIPVPLETTSSRKPVPIELTIANVLLEFRVTLSERFSTWTTLFSWRECVLNLSFLAAEPSARKDAKSHNKKDLPRQVERN
jgi:hypothetical protein